MGVHQSKLNVIGNNIANVNTYGFKSSRVVFSDVLYQNVRSSTAGENDGTAIASGGTNSSQLGYGVKVASIDKIMTNSSGADTGRSMDIFIDGDGFLIVNTKQADDPEIAYTRVGALQFDSAGNLVDGNGSMVLGTISAIDTTTDPITYTEASDISALDPTYLEDYMANLTTTYLAPGASAATDEIGGISIDPEVLDEVTGISIGSDGAITGIIGGSPYVLGKIAIGTFGNPDGMSEVGTSYFQADSNSGDVQITSAGENAAGEIISGCLEMSNVDLSREFTEMITAQRGFQANSRIVTVSDSILEELVNLKR
jgi:flagellar hook protein FlgE